jgi:hypothetical protein
MTTLAPSASIVSTTPTQAIRSPRPLTWQTALFLGGWVLLATMVFHVVALVVTGGDVTGPVSLRKPADFAETGWLACWAVALVLPHVAMGRVREAIVAGSVLLFGFAETTVMSIQAWRGVPSHYNFTTTFDAILMRGGAAGTAGVFLVGMVVLLVSSLRTHASDETPASLLLGVRLGVVVMLIGCVIGFVMISNMSGIWNGQFGSAFGEPQTGYLGPTPAQVGHEYVLLRPDTDGGDLVLLHAIGIHGLVLVTIPAALLAMTAVPEVWRRRLVWTTAAAVLGSMAVIASQSFRSQPLGEMGWLRMSLLAVAAAAALGSYAVIVVAWMRSRRTQAP